MIGTEIAIVFFQKSASRHFWELRLEFFAGVFFVFLGVLMSEILVIFCKAFFEVFSEAMSRCIFATWKKIKLCCTIFTQKLGSFSFHVGHLGCQL